MNLLLLKRYSTRLLLNRLVFMLCLASMSSISSGQMIAQPAVAAEKIPAMIGLSPGKLELVLGRKNRADGALKLINLSKKPIEIKASVHFWDLDQKNEIRLQAPSEKTLDQWLIVNPLHFTIDPDQHQIIRVSARPPFKPDPGEHRALLTFDQVPSQEVSEDAIQVNFRLNAGVYVLVEPFSRKGTVKSISINSKQGNPAIEFTGHSTGSANVRLDGQLTVWSQSEYPGDDAIPLYAQNGKEKNVPEIVHYITPLPSMPIFPGTTRMLPATYELPPDIDEPLIVHVMGDLGGEKFSQSFTLPNKPIE